MWATIIIAVQSRSRELWVRQLVMCTGSAPGPRWGLCHKCLHLCSPKFPL